MWFNNALIYQYQLDEASDLETALSEEKLKPCPPHARFIYGWLPDAQNNLLYEVSGSQLLCMGKEERILPRAVIHKMLLEKIQLIEQAQGRRVKSKERAQIAEDLEFELLPKAFCIQKKLPALLDKSSQYLIINTSSNTQATQLISLLKKSIPNISIEPLRPTESLALRFSEWIHSPETLPAYFQLASECLLFSLDDEKKRVLCRGYELPAQEIDALLAQGMASSELSLIWKDKIQFTLTQDLKLKKLKSLDVLIDGFNECSQLEDEEQQKDAAFTLLAGELRELIHDLSSLLLKKTEPQASNENRQVDLALS